MMPTSERIFLPTLRFLVTGFVLLGLVWLTPLTVDSHGHSFITRASLSSWSQPGDWVGFWCSFKIILLGLAGFLLIMGAIEMLVACERDALALACGLLIVLPIFTFLLGFYYLLKAIL